MTHAMAARFASLLVAALAGTAAAQPGATPPDAAGAPPNAAPTSVPVVKPPRAATPPPSAGPLSSEDAAPRAIVVHVAPATTRAGQAVELEAVIDAPFAEQLTARWRPVGEASWKDATFERSSAGGWYATLPDARPPGVEYYIRGADRGGVEVAHFASAERPHVIRVDPTVVDRLEEIDRTRLAGKLNQIALDVVGHDFGNRYDIPDKFLRAELTYTHRLLRSLHHIAFGFGAIQGRTPASENARMADENLYQGARYGFGEIRIRAHPSVFADFRLALGVSHDGFNQGARGQLIFGKPWRSSVAVGIETIGDLGPSAWVRLQWDTAPPLLMGASIMRTDVPGAVIGADGLYIAYDVAYRVAWFGLKAQVSYGSRDGTAHFGGGLGGAVDF